MKILAVGKGKSSVFRIGEITEGVILPEPFPKINNLDEKGRKIVKNDCSPQQRWNALIENDPDYRKEIMRGKKK